MDVADRVVELEPVGDAHEPAELGHQGVEGVVAGEVASDPGRGAEGARRPRQLVGGLDQAEADQRVVGAQGQAQLEAARQIELGEERVEAERRAARRLGAAQPLQVRPQPRIGGDRHRRPQEVELVEAEAEPAGQGAVARAAGGGDQRPLDGVELRGELGQALGALRGAQLGGPQRA
ncbi:MAG: hypothetical protein HS111_01460 [Kofleriaceae bacterium]|nr:hypothetical protein [Kofleriaceae bacterium]